MTDALPSVLAPWANFYILIGTSAATLTGLTFVVVTLAVNSRQRSPDALSNGISIFSTPTVLHFSSALLIAVLFIIPWPSLVPVAIFAGVVGAYGQFHIVRAIQQTRQLREYRADAEDWIWYNIVPSIAYIACMAGAVMLPFIPYYALFALAGSITLLTFTGIRNAWDLVVFLVVQTLNDAASESDPPGHDRPAD